MQRDYKSGNGLFTSIFSGINVTKKDIQAIKSMDQAMKNGSTKAKAWSDHLTGCTVAAKEQVKQCLINKGSLSELTSELNKSTFSAKINAVALQALSTVGNTLLFLGITKGIELATKGINNFIHSAEHCKERAEELISSYQSAIDTANSNATTAEELSGRYETLSKGVNNLGENVSLTAEEYSEYNNIVNQIASMFPTLIQGYTEEGNAILSLKGNVEQLRDTYKEAQQEAYNMLITSGENSDGNDIVKNWNNLNKTSVDFGSIDVGKGISYNKAIKTLDAVKNLSYEDYWDARVATTNTLYDKLSTEQKYIHNNLTFLDDNLGTNFHDKDTYAQYQQEAKVLAQTYTAEVESRLSDVETLANAYLMTNEDYAKLDTNAKTAASILVNNLNANIASGFHTKEDVGIYVDDIAHMMLTNQEVRDALVGLLTMDTTDMSIDNIQSAIDYHLKTITKYTKEDPDELKARLDLDNLYSQSDIDQVKSLLNDEDSNKIGQLTTTDLQIATDKITVPEGTILSWEQLMQKIEDVKNAADDTDPSTPLSFSEAWKQLEDGTGVFADDESINNTHNSLLDLAKTGQLTAKTLQETDGADTFLEQIGIGAEEAAEKIQNMLSTQEKLGAFSQGLSGLSSAFEEFQENKFVSAETLNSLPDAFKSLKGYDVFSQIVGDPKSGTQKIQDAFDQIVTEYLQSQNILDDATSQNKNQIIANLQQAGIGNAEDLVNSYVKSVEENKPLIQGASDEILQYLSNNNEADVNNFITALQSKNANYTELSSALGEDNAALLAKFGSQYGDDLANWITLLQQKEEAYNQFVQEYNDSLDGQQNYFDELDMPVERAVANDPSIIPTLTQNANKVSTAKQNMDNAEKDLEKTKQDTTKKYTKKLSKIQAKINVSDYQPKSPAESNDNTNSTPKETKQSFDWLERRISVLTSKLDLLKAKIENVFSVKKKNSIINDEIKNTNTLIKTYKQQAKTYKAQAKKSAKSEETTTGNDKSKLTGKKGKKLKKQIQTGQIKGSKKQWIQEYGEKTANAIEEYQNYWDKYLEALTNVQSAKTSIRELKIQKHQNKLDKFDAKIDEYDAKMENATTASAKNDLIKPKLKTTKKSYNQQVKIAEKEYGKNSPQVAKLKAEKKTAVRDIKIEKQQNLQDEADAYKDLLDAQIESATEVKEKNSLLQQQQAYITNSYNAQIKIADLEGNLEKKEELKIKKQKELLENEKQQLQNLSDEQSAQYDLNQQRESNANSAKEKNKFETVSRENLKSQYKYEIEIAKKNGDMVEAERLQLELNEKIEESYQRQIDNLKEEYDLIIGLNDARKSTINSQIAALQANGYSIAAELYLEQQGIDLTNYQDTLSKIRDITAEMQNLDPESQAYQNYLIELESYKQEAWGYQQAWAETQQAINDINLSKIEHVGTLLGYQANQLEHIQNILGHSDFTLSAKDGGGLTMEGLASVAVTFRQMQNNNDQVANKKAQLAEINRQIDAKEYVGSKEQAEEDLFIINNR